MENKELKDTFAAFIYSLADKINDTLWIKVILQAFPIVWTTVIVQIGRSLFITEKGGLNLLGGGIAIISAGISIFILVITGIKSQQDKKEKNKLDKNVSVYTSEIELRKAITNAECTLEDRRNRHLRTWIERHQSNDTISAFVNEALNPKERINTVFDGLSECFEEVTELQKAEVFQSAAIAIENTSIYQKPKWEWIVNPPVEGTPSLDKLLSEKSSFKIVADGIPFFYANDKKLAAKEKKYILDGRDKVYNGEGSIICCEIDETINNWKIRLIISISTYGKKIVSNTDEQAGIQIKTVYEDKIRDVIIKQIEGEIKEDLLWYALENIKNI